MPDHYDVRVFEGDLVVPGDLFLFDEGLMGLIVLGNLRVEGDVHRRLRSTNDDIDHRRLRSSRRADHG
jgi:hypothetical protein